MLAVKKLGLLIFYCSIFPDMYFLDITEDEAMIDGYDSKHWILLLYLKSQNLPFCMGLMVSEKFIITAHPDFFRLVIEKSTIAGEDIEVYSAKYPKSLVNYGAKIKKIFMSQDEDVYILQLLSAKLFESIKKETTISPIVELPALSERQKIVIGQRK